MVFLGFCNAGAFCQIGGLRAFDFLNLPGDARTAALGSANVSLHGNDVNAFVQNPSLLDSAMHNLFSISYLNYLGGVNFSNLAYARAFEKYGIWGINLKYIDYGSIASYDATGFETGEIDANEFVLSLAHSRKTGVFTLGGNLKFALSNIAGFKANAILLDLGGNFRHPVKDLKIGLVIKNIGIILKDYTELSQSDLPFDVQLGISFKPEHMPFRFSATAYNLYQADIAFFDPQGTIDNVENNEPGVADKIFRHFVFAAEFVPTENFNIRIGYNHLVRRELRLEEISGGAGFSFGLMFRVKAFEFAYSKALYHLAGNTNHLTLTSNFNTLIKKK